MAVSARYLSFRTERLGDREVSKSVTEGDAQSEHALAFYFVGQLRFRCAWRDRRRGLGSVAPAAKANGNPAGDCTDRSQGNDCGLKTVETPAPADSHHRHQRCH